MQDMFRGDIVRLAAVNPEEASRHYSRWGRDSFRNRLLDSEPAILFSDKAIRGWIEKDLDKENYFAFAIRTLAEDRLVGEVGLGYARWNRHEAFVGIGIGDREDWNKGYGTDAMRLVLRFAFLELALQRVSLSVFEYNPRAIRSYEKAGFRQEGRVRGALNREGRRWDEIFMGVLRSEWLEQNGASLQLNG
ncbi:MAG: hypothetical protein HFACDABA_00829 [Anaerolineales bacterium]|nr:hypothetical protein [Anaerolineales bacterium]